jgi:hypothetical protein
MILIQMKYGSHRFIGDVYYIPTVKKKKEQYIKFETIIGERL